jgi:hypothetical protein
MKKVVIIGLVSVITFGLGALALNASAFWGGKGMGDIQRSQEMIQLQEKIHEAIKNGNYSQWKELIGDRPMGSLINENNFARFAEMKKLMWDGKFTEANQIREELGLNKGFGNGAGMKQGKGSENRSGARDGSCGHARANNS